MSKKYRKCFKQHKKKKFSPGRVITMEFFMPMEPDETWVSDEKGPYRVFQRMLEKREM